MPATRFSHRRPERVVVALLTLSAIGALCWTLRPRPPQPTPEVLPPADAVARVGSRYLTEAELSASLQRRRRGDAPEAERTAALEDRIRRALLFEEAESSGFTAQPELQEAWRSLVIQRFSDQLEERRNGQLAISDADLLAHYAAHAGAYAAPERRHLALLLLPLPPGADANRRQATADEVAALHARALATAEDPQGFATLATRHSSHLGSRNRGGDIGWLQRSSALRAWPATVVDAAFALTRDGEISDPIATDEGWFILRRLEVQPATPPPFEQVRERVRLELTRTRAAEAEAAQMAELRERHGVEIYPERVAAVPTSTPRPPAALAQQPPAVPAP